MRIRGIAFDKDIDDLIDFEDVEIELSSINAPPARKPLVLRYGDGMVRTLSRVSHRCPSLCSDSANVALFPAVNSTLFVLIGKLSARRAGGTASLGLKSESSLAQAVAPSLPISFRPL